MHPIHSVAGDLGHTLLRILQGNHVRADHHHRLVSHLIIIIGRTGELYYRLLHEGAVSVRVQQLRQQCILP